MNVESILRQKGTEVATITPEASIKRAADWLRAKNVGALVVTSNDAILGIISERDIVRAFSQYGEPVASMQVKDIMTHGLITASLGDDLARLMHLMTRHRVRHIPVLRNGKLAGIVSIGDVVKHRLDDLELEASVLRDVYIATHWRAAVMGCSTFDLGHVWTAPWQELSDVLAVLVGCGHVSGLLMRNKSGSHSVSNSGTVLANIEASAMEIAGLVVGTISLLIAIYFGVRALQKK
jgi:CBS domain-containing protein